MLKLVYLFKRIGSPLIKIQATIINQCWINIGNEFEVSIKDFANKFPNLLEYKLELYYSKPDGNTR